MITQDKLKELLHYDPETGIFTWIVNRRIKKTGDIAGIYNVSKYLAIGVFGKAYLAHRLAWLYVYGEWPKNAIDHINTLKDDNRICNLREATHSQNLMNRSTQSNNKSGYRGVRFVARLNKWEASCNIDRKRYYLGCFDRIDDAHKAYQDFAKIHHGEFYMGHKS